MSDNDDIKTKFKGPGQWRSQAARLEADKPETAVERARKKALKE